MTPQLRYEPLTLHLRHTFTIARSSEDVAQTLLLHLRADGVDAVGESSPIGRYNESVDLVARQLDALDLRGANPWYIDDTLSRIPRNQRGAMCALDLALHDWAGKRLVCLSSKSNSAPGTSARLCKPCDRSIAASSASTQTKHGLLRRRSLNC